MNQLTIILAFLVAGAHVVFFFWPRKPLEGPTDEEGRPILWCNEDEQSKDVTCVWADAAAEPADEPRLPLSFSQSITAQPDPQQRSAA